MNLKKAIIIINNLDVSGLERKFRPKHSLIQINREGEIEGIYKYKENPSEEQQLNILKKHPKTLQIPAVEDLYKNEEELKNAINKRMWLFDKMKK
jgi:hypothetical protein